VQTDGVAGIAQHSRRCTDDDDGVATAKCTHAMLWPDEATQQQPCCSEKMHIVLGDGVDEVDADVGVECARLTGGGRLNPD